MYCTYAEEADDAANKVSQRKRSGITIGFRLVRCVRWNYTVI
jgi:hypothetical protein